MDLDRNDVARICSRKYVISGIIISAMLFRCMSSPVVAISDKANSVISTEANIKSLEEYLGLVQSRIKGNWHPPKSDETIRVIAQFRILPSGQIVNIRLTPDKKNTDAEAAAFQAVEQSTPFPQLTKAPYNKEGLECQIALDFNIRSKSPLDKELVQVSDQADRYSYKGDWQSAINVLDSAFARNPNNTELKQKLSDLYSIQAQTLVYRDPPRALELANKAIALDAQNREPYNRIMKAIKKDKKPTSENIVSIINSGSPTTSAQSSTNDHTGGRENKAEPAGSKTEVVQERKAEPAETKAEVVQERKGEPAESRTEVVQEGLIKENKSEQSGEAKVDEKPLFLWKATRGNQKVYLLGTIHVVKPDFYPVPSEIEEAFAQSQELFVECIPDRAKIISSAKSANEKRAYKNGDKLSNHLSPETKKVFEQYLDWAGEPMEIYERYRPSQVSGLISSDAIRRYGLKVPGLDMYLIAKAKQMNKRVSELESVDFQINLLSGFSEAEQDAQLLSALLDLKDIPDNLDGMMSAWRGGDTVKLEKLSIRNFQLRPELKEVNDKIIVARNQGMVSKLEDCLKDKDHGTYLVAVGAGHMVGDYGLPALLTKKDFPFRKCRHQMRHQKLLLVRTN